MITRNVNRQYDNSFAQEGAKIGTTLRIRLPDRALVTDGAALQVQDDIEQFTTLTVSSQKHIGINFTTAELTMQLDDFAERVLKPRVSQLASSIDADVANPNTTVAISTGTGTVTKLNESQRFSTYDWAISSATSEVATNQTDLGVLWSYTSNPTSQRNVYFVTDYVEPSTKGPFTSYISVIPSSSIDKSWLDARGAEGYQLQKVIVLSPINANGGGEIMCYMLSGSKY